MNKKFFRIFTFALSIVLLLTFVGCSPKVEYSKDELTKISFKSASSFEDLKSLDGKPVTINGYMATSSPVDGGYIFLMNLPFQSCPFCVPNTSQLSNTMAVYAPRGDSFSYTTRAIKVVGTLEVADSMDNPFTDEFGYEFGFKIVNATYTILDSSEMSADAEKWNKLSDANVIPALYKMQDYLNFVCCWPEYYVNSFVAEDGTQVPGYYLYAEDALNYLKNDGAQWNYGYQAGYFDYLVETIRAVDPNEYEDLVENVRKAESLAARAIAELEAGNYTAEFKYVDRFGTEDFIYTLNDGEALKEEASAIYADFEMWLASWEL